MQRFENFGGANAPNALPGCVPVYMPWCCVWILIIFSMWKRFCVVNIVSQVYLALANVGVRSSSSSA